MSNDVRNAVCNTVTRCVRGWVQIQSQIQTVVTDVFGLSVVTQSIHLTVTYRREWMAADAAGFGGQ